jgi:hypothetical protein
MVFLDEIIRSVLADREMFVGFKVMKADIYFDFL